MAKVVNHMSCSLLNLDVDKKKNISKEGHT